MNKALYPMFAVMWFNTHMNIASDTSTSVPWVAYLSCALAIIGMIVILTVWWIEE